MTNIASSPYWDDFDETKGFHQILFKPGFAVQARELTQLQSILREQISKFGSHIFKQGSVVIPGNVSVDLKTPYIKVDPLYLGNPINPMNFVGQTVEGNAGGVQAIIKHVAVDAGDFPTFYLVYTKGSGTTGINTFSNAEVITIIDTGESGGTVSGSALLKNSGAIGHGSIAHLNSGVFFANGSFVYAAEQTIAIGKYTSTPSCHLMLRIEESIVDSDADSTLLDPANGSYNYAAPGADRLKMNLVLTTLPYGTDVTTITDNFIELMRFKDGVMEENNRYAQYSELEKTLARRTADESGDYLVSGFTLTNREHLKTPYNSGVSEAGYSSKFVCNFTPGKAYIDGYEIDRLHDARLVLDKGRTDAHVQARNVNISAKYGQYIYVTDLDYLPNFKINELATLKTAPDGETVATARIYALDYYDGTPSMPGAIYKMYIHSLQYNNTDPWDIQDIGYYTTGTVGGRVVQRLKVPNATANFQIGEVINTAGSIRSTTVKFYNRSSASLYVSRLPFTSSPLVSEIVTGATSGAIATIKSIERMVQIGGAPLFKLPVDNVRSVKTLTNAYNLSYVSLKSFNVTADATGTGSFTVSGGILSTPEAGTVTITGPAGTIVDSNYASVAGGVTFTLDGAPDGAGVYNVVSQFAKSNLAPKTKQLQTNIISAVEPEWSILLGKCDVVRIVSIVDAGGDVWTSKFILNTGQTDFFYGESSILFNGTTLPADSLTITYEYFTHSAGDYFSADSYASLVVNPSMYEYLPLIPQYRSNTTNEIFDLRNYLDFRPRIGESNNFGDPIVPGSSIITTVQYYVPRIDTVYLTTKKSLEVVTGTPADNPRASPAPLGTLKLYELKVPAYTYSVDDIIVKKEKNRRYTMKDIGKLEDRIANVEYLSTLNASEQSLLTFEVTDAVTGLNRFKTGYLVDNFSNPFTVCDYFNPLSGTQFRSFELTPSMEIHDAAFVLDASNSLNFTVTEHVAGSKQITLPYTEVPFINQSVCTRVTNINHFLLVDWNGQLTIEPPIDNWITTEFLPEVFQVENNSMVVENVTWIDPPPPPPVEPVQTPVVAPPRPVVVDAPPIVILPTPIPVPIPPPPAPPVVVPEPEVWNPWWLGAVDFGLGDGGDSGDGGF